MKKFVVFSSVLCAQVACAQSFQMFIDRRAVTVANGPGETDNRYYQSWNAYDGQVKTDASATSNTHASSTATAALSQSAEASPGLYHLDLHQTTTNSASSGALNAFGSSYGGNMVYSTADYFFLTAPVGSWVRADAELVFQVSNSATGLTNSPPDAGVAGYSVTAEAGFNAPYGGTENIRLSKSATQADGVFTQTLTGDYLFQVPISGVMTMRLFHDVRVSSSADENNIYNRGTATVDLELGTSFKVNISVFEDEEMSVELTAYTLTTASGYDYGNNSIAAAYAQAVPEPSAATLLGGSAVLALVLTRRRRRA